MRLVARSFVHRLAVASIAFVLASTIGACGRDDNVYEPIVSTPSSGTTVAGTVRAQAGGPLANAVVTIESIENGLAASVRARIDHVSIYGGAAVPELTGPESRLRSAVTDELGRYAFTGVAPGKYVLTGTRDDHLAGVERLEVPPAAPESVSVDIVLTPTGAFHGSATLENATNHQSTIVYVEGTSFVGVTDPDGDYTITGIPVGAWTVRATHPGYLDESAAGAIAAAGDDVPLAAMLLKLDSNIPPTVDATAPPVSVELVPAQFNGSGSDVDGSVVLYEWDFENDGVFDTSDPASAAASHVYDTPGSYIAKLRVTDDRGAIGLDVVPVTVDPAVFVSSTTGAPGNPGTKASPLSTISDGIAKAVTDGRSHVLIANGSYTESPAISNGVSLRAGYHPGTWVHGGTVSTVTVGLSAATANGVTATTVIEQLRFVALDAGAGSNSIALVSISSTTALQFASCTFVAGNASAGSDGTSPGGTGTNGGTGNNGFAGSCDGAHGNGGAGGWSPGGCTGGDGGRGGLQGDNDGVPGATGSCGGGAGGYGGSGGDPGRSGGTGYTGANGSHGPNGSVAGGTGTIVGGLWTPLTSGSGQNGASGRGGGGGGGGGGQGCLIFCLPGGGNGGGGGGGGGQGGGGGSGGRCGWASFAVYLYNASPVFSNCAFESADGGAGGDGRNGAIGGSGGAGGSGATVCTSEVGRGGSGGYGGTGGTGGGGAGGSGGPSYCVWKAGSSTPPLLGCTYTVGTGGPGGAGGVSPAYGPAPSGSNGPSGETN